MSRGAATLVEDERVSMSEPGVGTKREAYAERATRAQADIPRVLDPGQSYLLLRP